MAIWSLSLVLAILAQHLWRTATCYEIPNVKRDGAKRDSQISNGKQEANNKEFKAKTYKKASLSTSLTNLYVTKLNFAIEITNKNWLVQSH